MQKRPLHVGRFYFFCIPNQGDSLQHLMNLCLQKKERCVTIKNSNMREAHYGNQGICRKLSGSNFN